VFQQINRFQKRLHGYLREAFFYLRKLSLSRDIHPAIKHNFIQGGISRTTSLKGTQGTTQATGNTAFPEPLDKLRARLETAPKLAWQCMAMRSRWRWFYRSNCLYRESTLVIARRSAGIHFRAWLMSREAPRTIRQAQGRLGRPIDLL